MKKILTFLLVLVLAVSCVSFAAATELSDITLASAGTVELDGAHDGTFTTSIQATKAQKFYNFQGNFSLKETESSSYFTLTELGSEHVTFTGLNEAYLPEGKVMWSDLTFTAPIDAQVGTALAYATYTVDKATPAGTYHLTYVNDSLTGEDGNPVTTEQVYTATITVTRAGASAKTYTVKAAASAAKVYPDATVAVTVTVGDNAFEGAEAVLTYDTSLFEYVSASDTLTGTTVTPGSGSVTLRFSSTTAAASGSALATLTFKARAVSATTKGSFGFSSAKAGETDLAYSGNWPAAATQSAEVSVVKQFTVKFLDKNGTQIGDPFLVDQGASVTAVPTAPEVDYHDFRAWTAAGADYTAEQIRAAAVTADVSYQAAYTPKTYTVTVPDTLNAAASAAYGTDYTGAIQDYDGTNYSYKVEFSTDGANWTGAAVSGSGFTVPGGSITGNLTLRLTRTIQGVEMTTVADYVDGWTLVLVKGTDGTAYRYDGNAMFRDAYTMDGTDYTFAWLIEGPAPENAGDLITVSDAAAAAIPTGFDVNNTGSVTYEDVQAAFGVMNKVGSPAVELMLRADVNRDGKVNAADLSAILADTGYTF